MVELNPDLVDVGPKLVDNDQSRSNSTKPGQTLANNLPTSGRGRRAFGRKRSKLAEVRPALVEVGPSLVEVDQIWPGWGQLAATLHWFNFVRHWLKFGRSRATFGRRRVSVKRQPILEDNWPNLAKLRSKRPECACPGRAPCDGGAPREAENGRENQRKSCRQIVENLPTRCPAS